ncbi:MAG TPA: GNAT family N-acetyltransferase [Rhizobacter sp.]|nr:GNAT family N-acetyltransferase [Rhizobacter sp.]
MPDSSAPKIQPVTVLHNAAQQRFECRVGQHLCVADYRLADGVMALTHTEVHPSLQGRGIAAALIAAALDHARAQGLKIDPQCSYAATYMQRHPQTHSLRI